MKVLPYHAYEVGETDDNEEGWRFLVRVIILFHEIDEVEVGNDEAGEQQHCWNRHEQEVPFIEQGEVHHTLHEVQYVGVPFLYEAKQTHHDMQPFRHIHDKCEPYKMFFG